MINWSKIIKCDIIFFIISSFITIIMISLEIAISNFKSLNFHQDPTTSITLKFGEISTTITLSGGEGGKCLYLNLSPQQLQQVYLNYACGLFILNKSGKFFSLLSFERMKLEDKIICNEIVFFNDLREVKYQCQLSLVAKGFKNPRIADTSKLQIRQNALGMLKKPPVPKQSPPKQKQNEKFSKTVTSFLYGNKGKKETIQPNNEENLQTLKYDLRKQSEVRSNLQKSKNHFGQVPKTALAKPLQTFEKEDPFQNNPPVMEFTNEQTQITQNLRVPQVEYIQYQESHEKSKQSRGRQAPKQNNFLTFNKNDNIQRRLSPQTPSQFELVKQSKVQPSKKQLSKQEIKMMAKQEAQNRQVKQNVMIPIARGNKFGLLPLSALRPEEIIDYVQKQRKNQEQAYANQLRKKELQQRQRQIEQKNKKLQQFIQKRQMAEKDQLLRRPSKQIRQSVHKQIKQLEKDSQNQQQNEQDYMSDFQSMSASNSIIKSRISSRGNVKNNISKEQQSMMEDDYAAQFDSYSHSALSKTNPKNPSQSVSDYSESYRSISQSYRK